MDRSLHPHCAVGTSHRFVLCGVLVACGPETDLEAAPQQTWEVVIPSHFMSTMVFGGEDHAWAAGGNVWDEAWLARIDVTAGGASLDYHGLTGYWNSTIEAPDGALWLLGRDISDASSDPHVVMSRWGDERTAVPELDSWSYFAGKTPEGYLVVVSGSDLVAYEPSFPSARKAWTTPFPGEAAMWVRQVENGFVAMADERDDPTLWRLDSRGNVVSSVGLDVEVPDGRELHVRDFVSLDEDSFLALGYWSVNLVDWDGEIVRFGPDGHRDWTVDTESGAPGGLAIAPDGDLVAIVGDTVHRYSRAGGLRWEFEVRPTKAVPSYHWTDAISGAVYLGRPWFTDDGGIIVAGNAWESQSFVKRYDPEGAEVLEER